MHNMGLWHVRSADFLSCMGNVISADCIIDVQELAHQSLIPTLKALGNNLCIVR